MLKNKKYSKAIIFLLLFLSINLIITGCQKTENDDIAEDDVEIEDSKDQEEEIINENNGKNFLGKSMKELMKVKEDGDIVVSTYKENWFGIDDVLVEYHADEENDKVVAILLFFPEDVEKELLEKNISEEIGEIDLKEDEPYRVEWIKEDNIMYRLEEVEGYQLFIVELG